MDLRVISIRWEGTGQDIARMEVTAHSTLKTIHSALSGYKPLKDKQYDFMYKGKPVPKEHWSVFQIGSLGEIIELRECSEDGAPPAPDDSSVPEPEESRSPKKSSKKSTGKAKSVKVQAVAKKAYSKVGKRRLQFGKGDVLTVLKRPEESPWWWCELNGEKGYAPKAYLAVVEDSDDEDDEEEETKSAPAPKAAAPGAASGLEKLGGFDSSGGFQLPTNVVNHLESILAEALGSGAVPPPPPAETKKGPKVAKVVKKADSDEDDDEVSPPKKGKPSGKKAPVPDSDDDEEAPPPPDAGGAAEDEEDLPPPEPVKPKAGTVKKAAAVPRPGPVPDEDEELIITSTPLPAPGRDVTAAPAEPAPEIITKSGVKLPPTAFRLPGASFVMEKGKGAKMDLRKPDAFESPEEVRSAPKGSEPVVINKSASATPSGGATPKGSQTPTRGVAAVSVSHSQVAKKLETAKPVELKPDEDSDDEVISPPKAAVSASKPGTVKGASAAAPAGKEAPPARKPMEEDEDDDDAPGPPDPAPAPAHSAKPALGATTSLGATMADKSKLERAAALKEKAEKLRERARQKREGAA